MVFRAIRDAILSIIKEKEFETVIIDKAGNVISDVSLSTRASEETLSGIKAQTDKLQFDALNYLKLSTRPQVEVFNETISADETFYIPSGNEVCYNSLVVNGKLVVAGRLVVFELSLGENGIIVLSDEGELEVIDI